MHVLADELGVPHVSSGEGRDRRLFLASDRDALPDKPLGVEARPPELPRYFVEGEPVVILHHREGELTGRVAVGKINRVLALFQSASL